MQPLEGCQTERLFSPVNIPHPGEAVLGLCRRAAPRCVSLSRSISGVVPVSAAMVVNAEQGVRDQKEKVDPANHTCKLKKHCKATNAFSFVGRGALGEKDMS